MNGSNAINGSTSSGQTSTSSGSTMPANVNGNSSRTNNNNSSSSGSGNVGGGRRSNCNGNSNGGNGNNGGGSSYGLFTPPDRFLTRAHLVEQKQPPKALLTGSKWDELSQMVWDRFCAAQQTEETYKKKMYLWRYLYLCVKVSASEYILLLSSGLPIVLEQCIYNTYLWFLVLFAPPAEDISALRPVPGWLDHFRFRFGLVRCGHVPGVALRQRHGAARRGRHASDASAGASGEHDRHFRHVQSDSGEGADSALQGFAAFAGGRFEFQQLRRHSEYASVALLFAE